MSGTFEDELSSLINRHSQEQDSNTPDFLLATYLKMCLEAYGWTVRSRDQWYGFDPTPVVE